MPLPHLQPLCSAAFLWKHGSTDTRHRHHPGASASLPTPVPPPPAPAVTSCCGIRQDKGNVFMENLHPIEIFWERSARTASCHAMNLVHPELRDSPACPAKGFQSCTPRPRPRLCTPTPPCPCVSLSHPVAPRTLRACAHPSLDLWGLGGDQEPITSPRQCHHIPPCSGSCVTYASTSVSSPVSLLSWAREGWVWVGNTPWDTVPMAGLRAAPMNPPSFHGCSTHRCLAAPQGTTGLGVGSALIHPQWAPGRDRDTGTGSVKIKPLFDWLDPGV